MGILRRIFGISDTRPPANQNCWRYSDGKVEVELAGAEELKHKGSAIRLEGKGLPSRLLLIHGIDGEYHAYENKCTHFSRRLDPLPGQPMVRCCSVNKSTFDYAGSKVSGPAKGSIKPFSVEKLDQKLVIRLAPS
jgi:nitrite reductase/ring-hydroxylating ferredoxin subunit